MDYLGFGLSKPMRLLPTQIVQQSSTATNIRYIGSISNADLSSTYVDSNREDTSSTRPQLTSTILKRTCSVDVDPKQISDRREWASAQYHTYYNPHCLFELEIRWLVSTSCILGDLITHWSQRTGTMLGANQVSFHLVPIPCDPFAEFDPLRGNDKMKTTLYIEMLIV